MVVNNLSKSIKLTSRNFILKKYCIFAVFVKKTIEKLCCQSYDTISHSARYINTLKLFANELNFKKNNGYDSPQTCIKYTT